MSLTTPQWRSPEQLEAGPEEFPPGTSEPDGLDRRDFLRMAGLSIAALSAAACTRQPPEEIVPYVRQPERLTPGIPRWYATAMEMGGNALGLLARSSEGRPTKLEGNPDHPMSLGRTNVHGQAALFDLYDPARSQVVRHGEAPSTWEDFLGALQEQLPRWRSAQGEGLALLSGRFNSPTLRTQLAALRQKYPQMRVYTHDPAVPPAAAEMRCDLDAVELIVSIDCDFLSSSCIPRDALAFARRRSAGQPIRLHVFESMPSLTGAMADRRYPLKPSDLENAAAELIGVVRGESVAVQPWIAELAAEFKRYGGKAAILVGPYQPAYLREMLGAATTAEAGLEALVNDLSAGTVTDLIVLDANPVYTAPADLHFAEALAKVPRTIHCGLYRDETAAACQWHIPRTHFLESWSDVVATDGTESIVQPLIEPMYATASRHEFFAALLGDAPVRNTYDILREAVAARHGKENFDARWQQMLHDGVIKAGSLHTSDASPPNAPSSPGKSGTAGQGFELVIRPDPHIWDGRFATNPWLQELPKPMTKLTWENAVHLSPRAAREHSIEQGDLLVLHYRDRALRAPAFIVPGHADGCVTIHLGYGRGEQAGLAWGIGFNAYEFQFTDALWNGTGVTLERTGTKVPLASTQAHQTMDVSDPVRFWPGGDLHQEEPSKDETLYPPVTYTRPSWGMVINLDTCIGCSTCTIACEVENNTPVVGREQVLKGREMHWIRVDRYFAGELEKPKILHQPVPCMHCEHAPCEVVCPVAATVHDHQGLNLMVYNRCIGTRYCSNNCPYKVRRFNFLEYTDYRTQQYKLARNPDVTVRSRGVMEKCTYCLQRIMEAQIAADKEDRLIRDGEVIPACAQACPSDAISFGDISDPASKVAALRRQPQNYQLLGDLNTRPRTTYLAKRAPTA